MLPNSNGHVTQVLDCPSDYEPRPILDIVSKPAPHWSASLAPATGTFGWTTAEGVTCNVTLRDDTLAGLLDAAKPLFAGVRKAKEKAVQASPEQPEAPQEEPMTKPCPIHGGQVLKRRASKDGGHFYSHRAPEGAWCHGKGAKS